MRLAWEGCGSPTNIILESLNLQVRSRREEDEVFGRLRDRGCDGIHMRGKEGGREFTFRASRMLKRILEGQGSVRGTVRKEVEEKAEKKRSERDEIEKCKAIEEKDKRNAEEERIQVNFW